MQRKNTMYQMAVQQINANLPAAKAKRRRRPQCDPAVADTYRYIWAMQDAIKAVKAGAGVLNPDGTLAAGDVVLNADEYSSRLVAADPDSTAALAGGAGLVVLDCAVTPELEAEGWAKDRIRELQDLRKSSGLDVSDRIRVLMAVPDGRIPWAEAHRGLIAGEILATSFDFGEPVDGVEIGDGVRVAIAKV